MGTPHARSPRGTCTAIAFIQFYRYAGSSHKGLGKYFTQEHVCHAGTDHGWLHSIFAHNVKPVTEGAGNTFLNGTEKVSRGMGIKIDAVKMRSNDLIIQHALGAVSKRQEGQSFRP